MVTCGLAKQKKEKLTFPYFLFSVKNFFVTEIICSRVFQDEKGGFTHRL